MTFLAAIRNAVSDRRRAMDGCGACAHFSDNPLEIERDLKGLAIFASAHASAGGRDGLCALHNRIINGRSRCCSFALEQD